MKKREPLTFNLVATCHYKFTINSSNIQKKKNSIIFKRKEKKKTLRSSSYLLTQENSAESPTPTPIQKSGVPLPRNGQQIIRRENFEGSK